MFKNNKILIVIGLISVILSFFYVVLASLNTSNHLPLPQVLREKIGTSIKTTIEPGLEESDKDNLGQSEDQWVTYQNYIYGFEINYPASWSQPQEEKVIDLDFAYEYKITFGTEQAFAGESNEGFYLFIYQNAPRLNAAAKDPIDGDISLDRQFNQPPECIHPTSELFNGNLKANQIFFDQFVKNNLSFVIFPMGIADPEFKNSQMAAVFDSAIKSFKFDIALEQKDSPAPSKVIPAKKPAIRKPMVSRKITPRPNMPLVCPHPDREPQKSKTQGKHKDEDCCPDPDEWPNPRCIYKSNDYRIMIDAPKK